MKITQKYLTKNDCYRQGATIIPKGIIVHSLGVAQPNGNKVADSWNTSGVTKAVHAFVTQDEIIQTLPWNMRCWGCGSGVKGSGNSTHIQFEICEPKGHIYKQGSTMIDYDVDKNVDYFSKVWKNSIDLCVYLCKMYGLTADKIICHSEAYKLGISSNHGDVMHWFPKHGKDMDDFRTEVASILHSTAYVPTKTITPKSTKKDIMWMQEKLNLGLPKLEGLTPLKVDGVYGNKSRIALLLYWERIGWNKDGKDDGWKAGKKTITILNSLY